MTLLLAEHFTFPVSDPVLKFLIILAIILFVPLILNKIRIPQILGLIISGAVIGPYGLNLVLRDDGIVLSGTAGLLYIMFLAGLEINMSEFVKNSGKSIIFGLYTFIIPMTLGIGLGYYVLHFSLMTSVLLASMFASHTLLTYPIISKMGVKNNRAVTVTIGGTVLAETLALLVLAVIVGMNEGEVNAAFWAHLSIAIITFSSIIFLVFPIITRLFFKRVSDGLAQYVFVLFMVFLGAELAELAGVEGIIGALFTGLALNRLIPKSSALMNRVEFIGNAIFIPFFLIGVGMLIDYRVFLSDWNIVATAAAMTTTAVISKYIAAYLAQKSFGYNRNERRVIFGLSSARAAATLAVVMVGYNVIIGYTADGEAIRLLNNSVLNGTIIMVFITCTIASFSTQRGAHAIAMSEDIDIDSDDSLGESHMLIPVHSAEATEELIAMANLMVPKRAGCQISIARVIDGERDQVPQLKQAKKAFETAIQSSTAADRVIETCLRYDTSYTNGITNLIREHEITDLLVDIEADKFVKQKLLSKFSDNQLMNSNVTSILYRSCQPIETIKRHIIIIPPNAELELGFRSWVIRIWSMLRSTGATASIYANNSALKIINKINQAAPITITTHEFVRYQDIQIIAKELRSDDGLIFALSKRFNPSFDESMEQIPHYINSYFSQHNFMLIYPYQHGGNSGEMEEITNSASIGAVSKIEDVVESIISMITRK